MNMKQTIIILGFLLLAMNLIAGLILSSYQWVNIGLTSVVIGLTTCLMLMASRKSIKDGFKPALILLYIIVGTLQFILLASMPATVTDNWYLITALLLLVVEVIAFIISNQLSANIR